MLHEQYTGFHRLFFWMQIRFLYAHLFYECRQATKGINVFIYKLTRVCGVLGSASAWRWGGSGFNSRPKPRHS